LVSADVTGGPRLVVDRDPDSEGSSCVSVRDLSPDLIDRLARRSDPNRLLRSVLRVRVAGSAAEGSEDLPDIFGRHQVLEDGFRFTPHFPFDRGVRFLASFDPKPLGRPELSKVLTLEFSLQNETSAEAPHVRHVYPSANFLPENLLRFYACFSNPMQSGLAEEHIVLLGPDGLPAPDVLYRPPVELWDPSMKCLTILLDPGRLKRWVGPNRQLGPPLKAGEEYALVIGAGMLDGSGCRIDEGFCKPFHVTRALRHPLAAEAWSVLRPAVKSREALELLFPAPLDWAQLWHAITVTSEDGEPVEGRIAIDYGERRWTFTPMTPWSAGSYHVRVATDLEDVCGNNLLGAFDRPLRSPRELRSEVVSRSIPFHV
jgi:hypothetical protein